MELYEIMRTTFAARDYTGDPVPDETPVSEFAFRERWGGEPLTTQ